jgi:hypothetical protein
MILRFVIRVEVVIGVGRGEGRVAERLVRGSSEGLVMRPSEKDCITARVTVRSSSQRSVQNGERKNAKELRLGMKLCRKGGGRREMLTFRPDCSEQHHDDHLENDPSNHDPRTLIRVPRRVGLDGDRSSSSSNRLNHKGDDVASAKDDGIPFGSCTNINRWRVSMCEGV